MVIKKIMFMTLAIISVSILLSSCSSTQEEDTTTDNIQVENDEVAEYVPEESTEEIDSTINSELITSEDEVEIGELI